MLDNQHECSSPPTANCTLWRYMDFTKLLSLLESEELFFTRADRFEDPYEGTWSKAGVALMRQQRQATDIPIAATEQILRLLNKMRQNMFISCWNIGEHESAAMWKLYLQSPEGVAIRTDHNALCAALETSPLLVRTTKVNYIDYETTPIPFNNLFFPFVHKRLSFAHENELRAIIWAEESINQPQLGSNSEFATIKVVPQELVKAVYVSPTAPKWFGNLVQSLLARYGLRCPVVHSTLYERPIY